MTFAGEDMKDKWEVDDSLGDSVCPTKENNGYVHIIYRELACIKSSIQSVPKLAT